MCFIQRFWYSFFKSERLISFVVLDSISRSLYIFSRRNSYPAIVLGLEDLVLSVVLVRRCCSTHQIADGEGLPAGVACKKWILHV